MKKNAEVKDKSKKVHGLSLIGIIACTVINIFVFILQVMGINFKIYIPYSIHATHYFLQIGYSLSEKTGAYMKFMGGVAASMLLVGIFILLYFWSFKNAEAFLYAFILYLLDTAFIFYVIFKFDDSYAFVDFVFHLCGLLALILAFSEEKHKKKYK